MVEKVIRWKELNLKSVVSQISDKEKAELNALEEELKTTDFVAELILRIMTQEREIIRLRKECGISETAR